MSIYVDTLQLLGLKDHHRKGKGRISSLSSISRQLFKAHYDGYHPRMSRQLATALKRYINTRPKHERKTSEFVGEVRRKIFCLHEYNLQIAKVKFKYPRSEQFDSVLVQYIELECGLLYNSFKEVDKEHENNVTQRVLRLLRVILHDALQNSEVHLKTTITACDKALLKIFANVRAECTNENKLVANTIIKLLDKLKLLNEVDKLRGKNIPFHQDTCLRDPLVCDVRQSLATSDYESDIDEDSDDEVETMAVFDDMFTPKEKLHSEFIPLSRNFEFSEHWSSKYRLGKNEFSSSCALREIKQNNSNDSSHMKHSYNSYIQEETSAKTFQNFFRDKALTSTLNDYKPLQSNNYNNLSFFNKSNDLLGVTSKLEPLTSELPSSNFNAKSVSTFSPNVPTMGKTTEANTIEKGYKLQNNINKDEDVNNGQKFSHNLPILSKVTQRHGAFKLNSVSPKVSRESHNEKIQSNRQESIETNTVQIMEESTLLTSNSTSFLKKSTNVAAESMTAKSSSLKDTFRTIGDAMVPSAAPEDNDAIDLDAIPDDHISQKRPSSIENVINNIITIEILDDDDDDCVFGMNQNGNEHFQLITNNSNLLQSNEIKMEENEENHSPNFPVPNSENSPNFVGSEKTSRNSSSTGLGKLQNNSSDNSVKEASAIVVSDSEEISDLHEQALEENEVRNQSEQQDNAALTKIPNEAASEIEPLIEEADCATTDQTLDQESMVDLSENVSTELSSTNIVDVEETENVNKVAASVTNEVAVHFPLLNEHLPEVLDEQIYQQKQQENRSNITHDSSQITAVIEKEPSLILADIEPVDKISVEEETESSIECRIAPFPANEEIVQEPEDASNALLDTDTFAPSEVDVGSNDEVISEAVTHTIENEEVECVISEVEVANVAEVAHEPIIDNILENPEVEYETNVLSEIVPSEDHFATDDISCNVEVQEIECTTCQISESDIEPDSVLERHNIDVVADNELGREIVDTEDTAFIPEKIDTHESEINNAKEMYDHESEVPLPVEEVYVDIEVAENLEESNNTEQSVSEEEIPKESVVVAQINSPTSVFVNNEKVGRASDAQSSEMNASEKLAVDEPEIYRQNEEPNMQITPNGEEICQDSETMKAFAVDEPEGYIHIEQPDVQVVSNAEEICQASETAKAFAVDGPEGYKHIEKPGVQVAPSVEEICQDSESAEESKVYKQIEQSDVQVPPNAGEICQDPKSAEAFAVDESEGYKHIEQPDVQVGPNAEEICQDSESAKTFAVDEPEVSKQNEKPDVQITPDAEGICQDSESTEESKVYKQIEQPEVQVPPNAEEICQDPKTANEVEVHEQNKEPDRRVTPNAEEICQDSESAKEPEVYKQIELPDVQITANAEEIYQDPETVKDLAIDGPEVLKQNEQPDVLQVTPEAEEVYQDPKTANELEINEPGVYEQNEEPDMRVTSDAEEICQDSESAKELEVYKQIEQPDVQITPNAEEIYQDPETVKEFAIDEPEVSKQNEPLSAEEICQDSETVKEFTVDESEILKQNEQPDVQVTPNADEIWQDSENVKEFAVDESEGLKRSEQPDMQVTASGEEICQDSETVKEFAVDEPEGLKRNEQPEMQVTTSGEEICQDSETVKEFVVDEPEVLKQSEQPVMQVTPNGEEIYQGSETISEPSNNALVECPNRQITVTKIHDKPALCETIKNIEETNIELTQAESTQVVTEILSTDHIVAQEYVISENQDEQGVVTTTLNSTVSSENFPAPENLVLVEQDNNVCNVEPVEDCSGSNLMCSNEERQFHDIPENSLSISQVENHRPVPKIVSSDNQTDQIPTTVNAELQAKEDVSANNTTLPLYGLPPALNDIEYREYNSGKKEDGGGLEILANICAEKETLAVKTDSEKEILDNGSDVERYPKSNVLQSTPKRKSKVRLECKKKVLARETLPRAVKQFQRKHLIKSRIIGTDDNTRVTRNRNNKQNLVTNLLKETQKQLKISRSEDPKYKPHDFIAVENSALPPRTNNVYAQKRLMETNTTSEDSNDSCESTLFIDLGENLKNAEKTSSSIYEEETICDFLEFVSTEYKTEVCISIPETEVSCASANFHILKQMEEFTDKNSSEKISTESVQEIENIPDQSISDTNLSIDENSTPNSSLDEKADAKSVKPTDHSIENILNKTSPIPEKVVATCDFTEAEIKEHCVTLITAEKGDTFLYQNLDMDSQVTANQEISKLSDVPEKVEGQSLIQDVAESMNIELVESPSSEAKAEASEQDLSQPEKPVIDKNFSKTISDESCEKTFKTKAAVKSYEDKEHPNPYVLLHHYDSLNLVSENVLRTRARLRARSSEHINIRQKDNDRTRSSSVDFDSLASDTLRNGSISSSESNNFKESSRKTETKSSTNEETSADNDLEILPCVSDIQEVVETCTETASESVPQADSTQEAINIEKSETETVQDIVPVTPSSTNNETPVIMAENNIDVPDVSDIQEVVVETCESEPQVPNINDSQETINIEKNETESDQEKVPATPSSVVTEAIIETEAANEVVINTDSQDFTKEQVNVKEIEVPVKSPDVKTSTANIDKPTKSTKALDVVKGRSLENTIKKMKEKIQESEKAKKEQTTNEISPENNMSQQVLKDANDNKKDHKRPSSTESKQKSVETQKKDDSRRKKSRSRSSSKSRTSNRKSEPKSEKEPSAHHKSSDRRSSSKSRSLDKPNKHHSDSENDHKRRSKSKTLDEKNDKNKSVRSSEEPNGHKKTPGRSSSHSKSSDEKSKQSSSDKSSSKHKSETKEKSTDDVNKKGHHRKRSSKSPPKSKSHDTKDEKTKTSPSKAENKNKVKAAEQNDKPKGTAKDTNNHSVEEKSDKIKSKKHTKSQEKSKDSEKIADKGNDKHESSRKSKPHNSGKSGVNDKEKMHDVHRSKSKENVHENQTKSTHDGGKQNNHSKSDKSRRSVSVEKTKVDNSSRTEKREKNTREKSKESVKKINGECQEVVGFNVKGKVAENEKSTNAKGTDVDVNKNNFVHQKPVSKSVLYVASETPSKESGKENLHANQDKPKNLKIYVPKKRKREKDSTGIENNPSEAKIPKTVPEDERPITPGKNLIVDMSAEIVYGSEQTDSTVENKKAPACIVAEDQISVKIINGSEHSGATGESKQAPGCLVTKEIVNDSEPSDVTVESRKVPSCLVTEEIVIDSGHLDASVETEKAPTCLVTEDQMSVEIVNDSEHQDATVESKKTPPCLVTEEIANDSELSDATVETKKAVDCKLTEDQMPSPTIQKNTLDVPSTIDISDEMPPSATEKNTFDVPATTDISAEMPLPTTEKNTLDVPSPMDTSDEMPLPTTEKNTLDGPSTMDTSYESFADDIEVNSATINKTIESKLEAVVNPENTNISEVPIQASEVNADLAPTCTEVLQSQDDKLTKTSPELEAMTNTKESTDELKVTETSLPTTNLTDTTVSEVRIAAASSTTEVPQAQEEILANENDLKEPHSTEVEVKAALIPDKNVPMTSSGPVYLSPIFSSSENINLHVSPTAIDSTVKHLPGPEPSISFMPTPSTSTIADSVTTTVTMSCDVARPMVMENAPSCSRTQDPEKTCLFSYEDGETMNRDNLNTSDLFHTSIGLEDISPTKLPLGSNQSLDLISPSTSIAEISNSMNLVRTLGTSSINFEVPDTSEIDIQQTNKRNFGSNIVTRVTEISCFVEKESNADHNYTLGDPLLGGNNEDKNILTTGLSLSNSPEEFQLNEGHLEDLSFNENFIEENGTLEELGLLLPCKKEKPDFDNIIDTIPKPEDIQNSIKRLNMLVDISHSGQPKATSVDNAIDHGSHTDCSVSLGIDYAVRNLLFLGGGEVASQNNSFSTIPDIENISIMESNVSSANSSKQTLEDTVTETSPDESSNAPPVCNNYPTFITSDTTQKVVVEPVEQCPITSIDQLKKDYIGDGCKNTEKSKQTVNKSNREAKIQPSYRPIKFATFLESVKREAGKNDTPKIKDEIENYTARRHNRTPVFPPKKKNITQQQHTKSPPTKKIDLLPLGVAADKSHVSNDVGKESRIRVKTNLIKSTDAKSHQTNDSSSLDYINEHDQSIASEVVLPFNKPSSLDNKNNVQEKKPSEVTGTTKRARFDNKGNDYIMENILNACTESKSRKSPAHVPDKPVKKTDSIVDIIRKRKITSDTEIKQDKRPKDVNMDEEFDRLRDSVDKKSSKADEEFDRLRNSSEKRPRNSDETFDKLHNSSDKRPWNMDEEFDKLRNSVDKRPKSVEASSDKVPSSDGRQKNLDEKFDKLRSSSSDNLKTHSRKFENLLPHKNNEQQNVTKKEGAATNMKQELLKNRSYSRDRPTSQSTSSQFHNSSKYRDNARHPGPDADKRRYAEKRHISIPATDTSPKRFMANSSSYSSKSDPCTTRDYKSRSRRMSTEQPNTLFPNKPNDFDWIDKFSGTGLFDNPADLFPTANKREDASSRK